MGWARWTDWTDRPRPCFWSAFVLDVETVRQTRQDPFNAQPSPGGKIRDLAPTDQCVSVCRCRWVCVRECVCTCAGGMSAPAAEPLTWPAQREKALDWRWSKSSVVELQASIKPHPPHRLLQLRQRRRECSSTGTVTGTTQHGRTRSDSLFLVRDPTWPSAVHYSIHQTCLGPPQTTDQVLGNQSAPCFERGGTALAIRGLVSGIAHPWPSERCWTVSAALRGLLGEYQKQ